MYQDSQSTAALVYDANATIVLAEVPNVYYAEPDHKPFVANAQELSFQAKSLRHERKTIGEYQQKIDKVREFILDHAKEFGEVTDELQEIAEILDIDLDTEVEIEMTIRYTATISVPFGQKVSSDDFEVRFDYNGDGICTYEDYDIENFDNGTY